MIKHLIDLWILKEYGIVIFSKSDPLDPDDQCLGGLLSALYSFTQSGFGETLLRFTTDRHQYYIIEQHKILFAGRFPRNKTIKEKYILKDLEKIGKKFFERFTKAEVNNWDHNINKFIGFHEEIKPRNDVLGDFIDSLWSKEVEQEN